MLEPLHYIVAYRNGDRLAVRIADFFRTADGKFLFIYRDNPKYEFPGFEYAEGEMKRRESDNLWEQISFRIPLSVRKQNPNRPPEELLSITGGKLVTDHFEFILAEKVGE